ncbi:MAG TPA: 30S ribosomal protein S20 [Actinobacteria bacterium]|nr:30S ribosomal protein S20 [Actinomycetota bacterium]
MPNIKSQIKRDRQNKKRTIKNKALKSRIKTSQKNLAALVESKKLEEAEAGLSQLNKALDKAVKGSAVHKNYSTNKKSQAAKLVNSIKK